MMGSVCPRGIPSVPTWELSRAGCCPGLWAAGKDLPEHPSHSWSSCRSTKDSSEDKGRGDCCPAWTVPVSLPVTGNREKPELTLSLSHHNPHREVPRASSAESTPEPLLWLHPATESLDALGLPWILSQHIPGKGIFLPKG